MPGNRGPAQAQIFAAIWDRADRGLVKGETPVVLMMDEAQKVITQLDASILTIVRSLQLATVAATQTVVFKWPSHVRLRRRKIWASLARSR